MEFIFEESNIKTKFFLRYLNFKFSRYLSKSPKNLRLSVLLELTFKLISFKGVLNFSLSKTFKGRFVDKNPFANEEELFYLVFV